MPKDDGTNAPLPHGDHQARARQMHPGAAEARGRNDSDSVSSSDDEGGAEGVAAPARNDPTGTREERRAAKIAVMRREKAEAKRAAALARELNGDGITASAPHKQAGSREATEAHERELEDEEYASWRQNHSGGACNRDGDGGCGADAGNGEVSLLERLVAFLSPGRALSIGEAAAGLGLPSSAALERRLRFLVDQGALVGVFQQEGGGSETFISFSNEELDALARKIESAGRLALSEVSVEADAMGRGCC